MIEVVDPTAGFKMKLQKQDLPTYLVSFGLLMLKFPFLAGSRLEDFFHLVLFAVL